eukprot:275597_1
MKQTILFVTLLQLLAHGILCANPGDHDQDDIIKAKGLRLNANAEGVLPSVASESKLNANAEVFLPSVASESKLNANAEVFLPSVAIDNVLQSSTRKHIPDNAIEQNEAKPMNAKGNRPPIPEQFKQNEHLLEESTYA